MRKITAFLLSFLFAFSAVLSFDLSSVNADEYTPAPDTVEHEVMEKINTLYELLDGKYFTTTGKTCGNSYCSKCRNSNVFKATWFKELFGEVSIHQIPGHAYPDGDTGYADGWSCHGFASFAMWYIFSSSNSDKVDYIRIVDNVTLTENNINKYAKPGDIIRYQNGDSGHSAIFISADENGITVLDCNARVYPDGYCAVRRRVMKYNGYDMAISRAENYVETPDLTISFDSNGGTVLGSTLVCHKYKVNLTSGLNVRKGAGLSFGRITTIPKNTEFTVDPAQTVDVDGTVWGKVTYGKYTGWAIISKYSTYIGEVMSTDYYIKNSMIYSSRSASVFNQSMVYFSSYSKGLICADKLGLYKEGYVFAGWSDSPSGERIFTPDSPITPSDIFESENYERKSVTLYAVWKPLHTHRFSSWTNNGNINTHFAICDCGYSIINDHVWKLSSETESESEYHCIDCGITKTVKKDNSVCIIDGEIHLIEVEVPANTWFFVNYNKVLNQNIYGQWNKL
ncbi:MAG: hypothetical protein E7675_06125 [Ruminococcaceae bacterium]|nr:hypothetical protein [Oscillospiraceae bacterium]